MSYIKVEEFTKRKKEEEMRGEDGMRSKGEKAVVNFRSSNNNGGLIKVRREDRSYGRPYGERRHTNERREEIHAWYPPKLTASHNDFAFGNLKKKIVTQLF